MKTTPFLSDKVNAAQTAFFLDFDGTLSKIVPDPALASVDAETPAILGQLGTIAGGALAVVSGRSIAQLDAMLAPLTLPMAGVHGLERRNAAGLVSRTPVDAEAQQWLSEAVSGFVKNRPGLLAELKPGSVALHYRKSPELAQACLAFAADLAGSDKRIQLVPGKMVIEMKLAARTKADAIAEFMEEAPFRGRVPFFAGDDVTDEAGFALVNALGGVTVKIGKGETQARHRVADPDSLSATLQALVARSPA